MAEYPASHQITANASQFTNAAKLALLRVQCFTAIQELKGDNLAEFWRLIDDLNACRPAVKPGEEAKPRE